MNRLQWAIFRWWAHMDRVYTRCTNAMPECQLAALMQCLNFNSLHYCNGKFLTRCTNAMPDFGTAGSRCTNALPDFISLH